MKDFLNKDIVIRIGSVFIAILFWLYVYNVTNPIDTKTFTNIPLKIENEGFVLDNGYILKNTNYKRYIDITVSGRRDVLNQVTPSDFDATLDFSQIKSVNDKTLKITDITCDNKDVAITSVSANYVDIQLTRNKSNTFQVQLVSNITLKPGYQITKTSMDPTSIPIAAEEALIDNVDSIKAQIDAKDVDSSINRRVSCRVYDKNGKELTALSTLIRNIGVNVSVEVAKEVPITIATKGKVPADYAQTSALVTPGTVLITGPGAQLSKITDIETVPIDISSLTQSKNISTTLALPVGIKLANDETNNVSVAIAIEKLGTRDITIPKDSINLLNNVTDGTLSYEIKADPVVKLKGLQGDLNNVQPDSLNPSIDVTGLGEGTHKLPLSLVLPSQVKLTQDVIVEVKISKVEAAQ